MRQIIKTTPMPSRHFPTLILVAILGPMTLAGCGTTILKHGQSYTQSELLQVQPGMSQGEVRMALGSPATTSTVNSGAAYYYIASTSKQTAFLASKEVDRKVVAVYFTPVGSVDHIAQYGMKDGKVFDFINRETPTAAKPADGVVQMLFRNLGNSSGKLGG
jgi:outer membrane protein assembly factor BamE (lipoprotein component of BamABCDE complex)